MFLVGISAHFGLERHGSPVFVYGKENTVFADFQDFPSTLLALLHTLPLLNRESAGGHKLAIQRSCFQVFIALPPQSGIELFNTLIRPSFKLGPRLVWVEREKEPPWTLDFRSCDGDWSARHVCFFLA